MSKDAIARSTSLNQGDLDDEIFLQVRSDLWNLLSASSMLGKGGVVYNTHILLRKFLSTNEYLKKMRDDHPLKVSIAEFLENNDGVKRALDRIVMNANDHRRAILQRATQRVTEADLHKMKLFRNQISQALHIREED